MQIRIEPSKNAQTFLSCFHEVLFCTRSHLEDGVSEWPSSNLIYNFDYVDIMLERNYQQSPHVVS